MVEWAGRASGARTAVGGRAAGADSGTNSGAWRNGREAAIRARTIPVGDGLGRWPLGPGGAGGWVTSRYGVKVASPAHSSLPSGVTKPTNT